MKKGLDERIYEGVLQWLSHVERMENDRIAKRVYIRDSAGNHSVCRSRKRWIDTVRDCLKKTSLDVRQARRLVHDRRVWWGSVSLNAWGFARGMNP